MSNIVSTLSDSAAYMRGKISGFETRLRQDVPGLLDIDGDTCHKVHNASKKLCQSFDWYVESMFTNIFNDLTQSAHT